MGYVKCGLQRGERNMPKNQENNDEETPICPKCHRPMNLGNSPNEYECTETNDENGLCAAYEKIYVLTQLLNGYQQQIHG